eukprot:6642003-Pyramimonas_sp.AAC.1
MPDLSLSPSGVDSLWERLPPIASPCAHAAPVEAKATTATARSRARWTREAGPETTPAAHPNRSGGGEANRGAGGRLQKTDVHLTKRSQH